MPEECVYITQHEDPTTGEVTYTYETEGESGLCGLDVTQHEPENFPHVRCHTEECMGECVDHTEIEGPPVWKICCKCEGV